MHQKSNKTYILFRTVKGITQAKSKINRDSLNAVQAKTFCV